MKKNIIIHTSDICADGIGDLIYLLNWLKVFHKFYKGQHEQLVIIFADNIAKVEKFLISFKDIEPEHPFFNYFSIAGNAIKSVIRGGQKLGILSKSNSPMAMIDIRKIFPQVTDKDVINLFKISTSGSMIYKNLERSTPVDKLFGIFEFDAIPPPLKKPNRSTLGLESNDLGLLHDIDGITGTEDVEVYLEKLSPTTKKLIFQNENISISKAKAHLLATPSVFAYLFPLYDTKVLEAALQSPIIQQAIEQGKTPLFFISSLLEGITLPSSLQEAAKKDKIRIITSWLPTTEFNLVNAIFMNHGTNSIVIPSGDNTLTACIKAGKFPLYAHKQTPDFIKFLMQADFKLSIFKTMIKILNENATKSGWDKIPGFKACKRTLVYLAQATNNTEQAHNAAKDLQTFITEEMLSFFRITLAPYLMENFAFENKTLPKILSMITMDTATKKQESVASSTVQFDALKAKPQVTTAKPETTKNEPKTSFGFKAGFLL